MHDPKKTYGRKMFFAAMIIEMARDYMAKMEAQIKELNEKEILVKRNSGKKRF